MHVPYKGGGQAMSDALGGNIPLVYTAVAGAIKHVEAGKLNAIAVSSRTRSPSHAEHADLHRVGRSRLRGELVGGHPRAREDAARRSSTGSTRS